MPENRWIPGQCGRARCREKHRHVHCQARLFSGRKCNNIASTSPCGLCVLRGRTEKKSQETEF